jgi:hypothetical protein
MTSGLTTVTATSALSRETPTKETPETALGEAWRDSAPAEVDQFWLVVAGMGQWWSEVDAGVEQGR